MYMGGYFEPSSALLSHRGGHFGLPEALLEPSWAILSALMPRAPPFRAQGGGHGEGQTRT
eukprot:9218062-Pyramimonas_sp.AAC.2